MLVSQDDLEAAIEWLRSYEPGPGEDAGRFERIAAYLQKGLDQRAAAALVRAVAREASVSAARARRALRATKETDGRAKH